MPKFRHSFQGHRSPKEARAFSGRKIKFLQRKPKNPSHRNNRNNRHNRNNRNTRNCTNNKALGWPCVALGGRFLAADHGLGSFQGSRPQATRKEIHPSRHIKNRNNLNMTCAHWNGRAWGAVAPHSHDAHPKTRKHPSHRM